MIHANSIAAYWQGRFQFSQRENELLGYMLKHNKSLTDRQLKDALGYSDMNAVRPRITELIEKGCIEESGNVQCNITGKQVRLIRIKPPHPDKQLRMTF